MTGKEKVVAITAVLAITAIVVVAIKGSLVGHLARKESMKGHSLASANGTTCKA